MNIKKAVLYLLAAMLCVVLLYNYIIAPLIWQYSTRMGMGMGMGMHGMMQNSYGNYININIILLLFLIIIAVLVIFNLLGTQTKINKCSKCGYDIVDERWKICPICGTPVRNKKGDRE